MLIGMFAELSACMRSGVTTRWGDDTGVPLVSDGLAELATAEPAAHLRGGEVAKPLVGNACCCCCKYACCCCEYACCCCEYACC
jgi:hypothetical protein